MKAHRYLSLISDEDGSCASRIDLSSSKLRLPEGMKDIDHPPVCWRWERLRVFETDEVGLRSTAAYPLDSPGTCHLVHLRLRLRGLRSHDCATTVS